MNGTAEETDTLTRPEPKAGRLGESYFKNSVCKPKPIKDFAGINLSIPLFGGYGFHKDSENLFIPRMRGSPMCQVESRRVCR